MTGRVCCLWETWMSRHVWVVFFASCNRRVCGQTLKKPKAWNLELTAALFQCWLAGYNRHTYSIISYLLLCLIRYWMKYFNDDHASHRYDDDGMTGPCRRFLLGSSDDPTCSSSMEEESTSFSLIIRLAQGHQKLVGKKSFPTSSKFSSTNVTVASHT